MESKFKSMSIFEFQQMFSDDRNCMKYFSEIIWFARNADIHIIVRAIRNLTDNAHGVIMLKVRQRGLYFIS
ncbi:MAG: hypothetical protein GXO80_13050 [Chlorobi bacterium]|nr:hypothetical protein [Chlorobiota bacterium]